MAETPFGADTPAGASPVASLVARLEEVERDNRRLRRYGTMMLVALAVVVGIVMSMVLLTGRFGLGVAEVVTARQFVVRGRDGAVRGVWGTEADGTLRLALQDAAGHPRTKLTLLNDGSSGISLVDSAGHPRVVFALLPDQSASVVFADAAGRTRSVLGMSPGGDPTLVFADRDGVTRAGLGVDERGAGSFTLVDRSGRDPTQAEPETEVPADSAASAEPAAAMKHRR